MPWIKTTLKAPKPCAIEAEPTTLGEHLRRARLTRKLTQREAARILGTDAKTVCNWEKRETEPLIVFMPRILQFLGYNPFPEPTTLSERMLAKRREMGWTLREAARELGVDPGTWGEWEWTGLVKWERYRVALDHFLEEKS